MSLWASDEQTCLEIFDGLRPAGRGTVTSGAVVVWMAAGVVPHPASASAAHRQERRSAGSAAFFESNRGLSARMLGP